MRSSSAPAALNVGSSERPIWVTSGPLPEAIAVVSLSPTASHGTASTSTVTPVCSSKGLTSSLNFVASSMVQIVTVVPAMAGSAAGDWATAGMADVAMAASATSASAVRDRWYVLLMVGTSVS